jgi:hypothetical protein
MSADEADAQRIPSGMEDDVSMMTMKDRNLQMIEAFP